jgi:hypothetical protein
MASSPPEEKIGFHSKKKSRALQPRLLIVKNCALVLVEIRASNRLKTFKHALKSFQLIIRFSGLRKKATAEFIGSSVGRKKLFNQGLILLLILRSFEPLYCKFQVINMEL